MEPTSPQPYSLNTGTFRQAWISARMASLSTSDVVMTPLVVDLDKDGKPEIVFSTIAGELIAIRGNDCVELWRKPVGLGSYTQLAAADFDKDGYPELVGLNAAGVKLFDRNGVLLASGDLPLGICSGPAIAWRVTEPAGSCPRTVTPRYCETESFGSSQQSQPRRQP